MLPRALLELVIVLDISGIASACCNQCQHDHWYVVLHQ